MTPEQIKDATECPACEAPTRLWCDKDWPWSQIFGAVRVETVGYLHEQRLWAANTALQPADAHAVPDDMLRDVLKHSERF